MAEDLSPLRKAIQRKRTRARTMADAQSVERAREQAVAEQTERYWPRAKELLDKAIEEANSDFEAEGDANRFKYDSRPQAGTENYAFAVVSHLAGQGYVGPLSETEIFVQRDGRIAIHRPRGHGLPRDVSDVQVAAASKEVWEKLLLRIYEEDCAA